ncbi:DUF7660 family protein [Rubinisphaera margarita]|uniref:DUF7660 family protein n=1 Tax=Rubinisphaera margarita TaxID=2909586 RepID=UPI001EE96354|nr:hypothetical protein [Rubinisphaera margarita]MCG6157398.1 hypothetical protein [Rubinisphaera margarita]
MKSKLHDLAASVEDEESFILFVKALVEDREIAVKKESISPSPGTGPETGGWENGTIEDYLKGALAWAEDSEFGRSMAFPEFEMKDVSDWKRFASFLMAGKVHE